MDSRPILAALVVALLLLSGTTPADAQNATSPAEASPAGASQPLLDAAAMLLTPADAGPGYTFETSGQVSLGQVGLDEAQLRGQDPVPLWAALADAGWKDRQESTLGMLDPANPDVLLATATSSVDSYATAQGAAKGFALLTDVGAIVSAHVVQGTKTFGDATQLTHLQLQTDDTPPRPQLELVLDFRIDTLAARVTIANFTQESSVTTIEALAGTFLARITHVEAKGGPGLSTQVPRLAVASSNSDVYTRLGGVDARFTGETDADFAARTQQYADATDVYDLTQTVTGGPGDSRTATYAARIFRFSSAKSAAAFLAAVPKRLRQDASFASVKKITPAPPGLGAGALVVTDTNTQAPATNDARIYVRVGRDVALILVSLPAPAQPSPAGLAQALATSERFCLEHASAPCPLTTIPAYQLLLLAGAMPVPADSPIVGTPAG